METLTFFFSKTIYLKLFKASEYPKKIKKLKTICCIYAAYSTKMKRKCVSLTKMLFLETFKANSVTLHFLPKCLLKK